MGWCRVTSNWRIIISVLKLIYYNEMKSPYYL
jgi:hypothetical protein